MLSPNFDHMFDFNLEEKCLRVVDTVDQTVLLEVPKDVITTRENEDEVDGIREVFAKVHFSHDNVINIFNDTT